MVNPLIAPLGSLVTTIIGIINYIQTLPDIFKVLFFIATIQISFIAIGTLLCPGETNLGITDVNVCIAQPELFASQDGAGNIITGTGIPLFSSSMANVLSLILIFGYILNFAVAYFSYVRV